MSRILFVALFLLSLSLIGNAQFNLKIGYESAFIQSAQNKKLVEGFNTQNATTLSQGKEMSGLGLSNGLTIGILYSWEASRISVNWHSATSRRGAFGETVDPVMSFEKEARYRMAGFGLQYEMVVGRVSAGVGVGRDVFKMTSLIDGSSNDKTILNEVAYNLRFNIGVRLISTERVSVILEPYYTYLLNDVDHLSAYSFFGRASQGESTIDRPHYFGVQLLFYNGEK